MVGGSLKEWCYVPGALAQLKRYLDTGIDAFFADDPGLARRALSGKTPR
ncbi:glycerophosphodiester phosphodiesterase [Xanthomonas campestris pv. campestris]|nr:glycerophosphodiester phosphodiesterase [Xanthomonas campestris pv. campestris]WDJ06190.1 glycerophosphodiester phosphodiesterase [Xanthomonas campestris pv. incanae]MCD0261326.1 glycerophosphodiester phosphodiesterase [Xanthomonas campestris pv. campestris]MCD0270900.1 glycerophosphodiester phosphodiesterase [Xanthomonas campestris pv. campestris]MCD0273201.1 glycerophosphodiester phosphodiesterase [Xanthomonas campestris pv. campestris]